jgi:hypothetical protein
LVVICFGVAGLAVVFEIFVMSMCPTVGGLNIGTMVGAGVKAVGVVSVEVVLEAGHVVGGRSFVPPFTACNFAETCSLDVVVSTLEDLVES